MDNKNNIFLIDEALNKFESAKKSDKSKFLIQYFDAIAYNIKGSSAKQSVDIIFDKNLRIEERKFIAICLLRLFTIDNFSFDKMLRIKVYLLFDSVLSKDIYPRYDINSGLQNFEKEQLLRDITLETEIKLSDLIESLLSLKGFNEFRKEFMKTICNQATNIILSPFLPKTLITKSRLNLLFGKIDDYIKNRSKKKLKTLEKGIIAQNDLKQFIQEAHDFNTVYANQYLVSFARNLNKLIEKDIQQYDEGKPTNLSVYKSEKKYPLHEIGRKLFIEIQIENEGPGYAFNVELNAKSLIENIRIEQSLHNIGRLEPSIQSFRIPAKVIESEKIAFIEIEIAWKNFDNSISVKQFEFEIDSQRSDIDWSLIELEQPYNLEPIESVEDLVGREKIINQLVRQSCAKSIGSSYIFGQKRVGKTSIVRALKSRLSSPGYIVVYLEGGDFVCPSPHDTIHNLGKKLCRQISCIDSRFSHIQIPAFKDGALSPIIDYLDSITLMSPEIKIVFILDEFDELPIDLYKRGPLGDSFFLTLRSISGKPQFGFLLVGGERMEFIMSCQGDVLNKFTSMRVDYFDKMKFWNDFKSLVKNPVKDWFDITDKAVSFLYEQTAGNPFYTKWICARLFEIMLDRRDCHITISEIKEACNESLNEIASNSFQHFWEDGIFEISGDRCEEVSIRRRKILLAIANLIRYNKQTTIENIYEQDIISQYDYKEVTNELNQFVRRHVLNEKSNSYQCMVNFFKEWLINTGISEIMTTFSDLDSILERRKKEEESYIRSEELVELISEWGLYKGQKITEDMVRSWLQQFGDNVNQRLMFKILQGVSFYSSSRVREKMREAHGIVTRGLVYRKDIGQRKRGDILVSYFDGPGKSGGGIYAKLYADENNIYADNVIEKNKISKAIKTKENLNAIVLIDDFIGSGQSATDYFNEINDEIGSFLINCNFSIYFIAICGFVDKKIKLEQHLKSLNLPVKVNICDPLDDSYRCFSEKSTIFNDAHERQKAKELAYEYGSKIIKKNYLGYGDCQTAIIFETNCPNNNLPILWVKSSQWYPLFRRL